MLVCALTPVHMTNGGSIFEALVKTDHFSSGTDVFTDGESLAPVQTFLHRWGKFLAPVQKCNTGTELFLACNI